MNKIIYLGHYSLDNERKVSPAGNTMMNYVINVLENQTQELYIISIAQKNKNLSKEISNLDNKKIIYLPSYKNDGIFNKLINRYKRKRDLYNELNDLLEDGDILIVYHSLAFINLLRYIKNKKNVKLILQVCEIYADVLENEKIKEKEIKCIQQADKYIFSTNRLEEILNKKKQRVRNLYG